MNNPLNSPLAYIGGKSKLSKTIIGMMPEHKQYCEVFAGAAWVFFRKEPSKFEVINDLDSDLVTFYRVLQHHLDEFLRQFRWMLSSRQIFEEWKHQQEAGGLTDIQRSARYYYLQRLCFGGRVRARTYGANPMHKPRINLLRLEEELSTIHLRLAGVCIENLPWNTFVKTYNKPGTLFYMDPPYYKLPYYNHNLGLEDYREMAKVLADVKGSFILSINDHPDIREVFKDYRIETVSIRYTVSKEGQKSAKELLITNF